MSKVVCQHAGKSFGQVVQTCLLLLLSSYWSTSDAQQPEYISNEKPILDSVSDMDGSLALIFERLIKKQPLWPGFKNRISHLDPFLRDTALNIRFRSYYFNRNKENNRDSLALTYGGQLAYRSGWWKNFLHIGASLYTSQKLMAPAHKEGSLLLRSGQHGLATFAEIYLVAKFQNNIEFKAFRQSINLPYLNKQDSRMLPNTFEAYLLSHKEGDFKWITGYVQKMKKRNSSHFETMSRAAGLKVNNKGLWLVGWRYALSDDTDIGAVNYTLSDYINTFYGEANHVFFSESNSPIRTSFQYTNQQSIGSATGGKINTYSAGAKISMSYQGIIATAATTITGRNHGIQKPFGGTPSYLSIMVEDFDRAGENAWLIGLSYHFSRLGFDDLSVYTNYASGNTPETGHAASADQKEWDITVDYKPFNGLSLRLRRASVHRKNSENLVDYRVILNYEIHFL